jgi:hypothetical protein
MNTTTSRIILCIATSFAIIALFYVLREHWGHALGLLPYLFLMLCPVLHLLHGHGSHDTNRDGANKHSHSRHSGPG